MEINKFKEINLQDYKQGFRNQVKLIKGKKYQRKHFNNGIPSNG